MRSSHRIADVVLTAVLIAPAVFCLATLPAYASWPPDSTSHLVVSRGTGNHSGAKPAHDGADGAIVAWTRQIGSDYDVLAQRVRADGRLDPSWPEAGLLVITGTANQQTVATVADGAGGAYVLWIEWRDATRWDLIAQHVLATGVPDAGWPAGGAAVCAAPENQQNVHTVEDGVGGAFVVWEDERPGEGATDVYAHHLLATGLDPAWPTDGLGVSVAANRQDLPEVIADGAGGMIVAWRDGRPGASLDIYAQKVSAAGAPMWVVNGLAVCTAAGFQWGPSLASDGAGGAVIVWQDDRNSATSGPDVYAQHVRATGSVDPSWPVNGAVVVNRSQTQSLPRAISDQAGGALVVWSDNYWGTTDLAAHHLLSTGALDPAWTAVHGAAYELCRTANTQADHRLVPDGAGGAIVTWYDGRSGNNDVYAMRLPGTVPPAAGWPENGLAVAVVPGTQSSVLPVPAAGGDAIVFWTDANTPSSVRAARVSSSFARLGSSVPVIAGIHDVPGDQGGHVRVLWEGCAGDVPGRGDIAAYRLWRRTLVGGVLTWEYIAEIPSRGVTGYAYAVETAHDSTFAGVPWNVFVVRALLVDGVTETVSAPDSGYSVDDLSPATPQQLAGEYADGATTLRWLANAEPDVVAYRLYGGDAADFVPGPVNRIAEVAGTTFEDAAGPPRFYRLSAVDVRDNEGPFARLDPAQVTSVPDPMGPGTLGFSNPQPNPLREACTFELALPRAGPVTLAIYDPGGRLVRVLLDGRADAGRRVVVWDGRDVRGRSVCDGLYFVRLRTADAQLVRRLAVVR